MNMHLSHPIRTAALGLAVLAATATTLAVTAHPSRAASAASIPACRTSMLSAKLEPGSPGAGQRYATLVLTNRSSRTCHTYGYAGLGFLDRHARTLPTNAVRIDRADRGRVVLAAGASAAELLHWGAVASSLDPPSGVCEAPSRVEITPPDEFSHLTIAWTGGPVCERGRVDETPLVWVK